MVLLRNLIIRLVFAKVKKDGKWGLIDQTGKVILSPQFDNLNPTDSEYLFSGLLEGKAHFIDGEGKISGVRSFDHIGKEGKYFDELAAVKIQGR